MESTLHILMKSNQQYTIVIKSTLQTIEQSLLPTTLRLIFELASSCGKGTYQLIRRSSIHSINDRK